MPARILVVEDEPELRRAITVRLTAAGFTCDTAGNGKEALLHIERTRPDLIVADLLMPEMNGHELVQQLGTHPGTAAIPVVVLTALPEQSRLQWAQALMRVRVLDKPFDSAQLLAIVQELLRSTPGGSSDG